MGNEGYNILWDFNLQTDHGIEARRPDIVVMNKQEKNCQLIDVAIPEDTSVKEKEDEKKKIPMIVIIIITLQKELHTKSDSTRVYVKRENGERGPLSCEDCVITEENSLAWYVDWCEEPMLIEVTKKGTLKVDVPKAV